MKIIQKKYWSLWQYYRDQPALNNDGNISDFNVNDDTSLPFKYKINIIGRSGNDGTKKYWNIDTTKTSK